MNSRNRVSAQNYLGTFGFSGEEVFLEIGTLSGGECARRAVALMTLSHADLLVLDEPTNHPMSRTSKCSRTRSMNTKERCCL